MSLREAAQQALDALESLQGGCTDSNDGTVEAITVWCPEVIDAIRAALEQPVQEPVAWSPSLDYPGYEQQRVWANGKPRPEDIEYWAKNGNGITYAYTHPPRREWNGDAK